MFTNTSWNGSQLWGQAILQDVGMKCKAAIAVILLVFLTSDFTSIDAADLTDATMLPQMFNNLSAKYDGKLADMNTKLNSVLVTTNSALMNVEGKLENAVSELTSVKSDLQLKSEQLGNLTSALGM